MTRHLTLGLLVLLTIPVSASAQEWRLRDGFHGLREEVLTVQAQTPDGPAVSALVLGCLPHPESGREGISFSYQICDFKRIKAFDFLRFSGPNSPVQGKRLATIRVWMPGGRVVIFRRRVEGEGSMDIDTDFEFVVGYVPFVDLLAKGAVKVSWLIQDDRSAGRFLYSEFTTAGANSAIDELYKIGCIRAPRLNSKKRR